MGIQLSTVQRLPEDMLVEVRKRLRSARYTQLEVLSWLLENGFNISRSALNRYAICLRDEDESIGLRSNLSGITRTDVIGLFEELASLKKKEFELIELLKKRNLK